MAIHGRKQMVKENLDLDSYRQRKKILRFFFYIAWDLKM
jgi:hypothetical protein